MFRGTGNYVTKWLPRQIHGRTQAVYARHYRQEFRPDYFRTSVRSISFANTMFTLRMLRKSPEIEISAELPDGGYSPTGRNL